MPDHFTHGGETRELLRIGSGPAVIVIAEMPGITPKVLEFAQRVADLGCTAVLPVLFGTPGREPSLSVGNAATMLRACVSREFTVWATGKTSPVVDWLRALAMATHASMVAPVLSQPSLPLPITPAQKRAIDISPGELDQVKHRCAHDGLKVVGLRFKGDKFVPAQRFAFLREQLGDAFVAVELEDADANPDGLIPPHSVLTEHLIDEPGQPTRAALDLVLDHFRTRLLVA